MSEVLVICPNHGIIKRVEMACMWLGRPPMPEVENAFCPLCGAPTVIERPKNDHQAKSWTYNKKDDNKYKESEIKFYRDKYKKEFGLE
jgi:hypothetical protein